TRRPAEGHARRLLLGQQAGGGRTRAQDVPEGPARGRQGPDVGGGPPCRGQRLIIRAVTRLALDHVAPVAGVGAVGGMAAVVASLLVAADRTFQGGADLERHATRGAVNVAHHAISASAAINLALASPALAPVAVMTLS